MLFKITAMFLAGLMHCSEALLLYLAILSNVQGLIFSNGGPYIPIPVRLTKSHLSLSLFANIKSVASIRSFNLFGDGDFSVFRLS